MITRFCISPAVRPYAPKPAASGNFLFLHRDVLSLVLNTVGVRDPTPALLFDKTDWQGAVRGVHQDRVSQQPARLRVSGGIPWSSDAVLWLKLMVVVSSSARSSG